MGMQLDGSIDAFQTNLYSKGMKLSEGNDKMDAGCRMYNGVFCGHNAQVFVYFNPYTKLVYRAKAVIHQYSLNEVSNLLSSFQTMLSEKYQECRTTEEGSGASKVVRYFPEQGEIDMYIINNADFYLHVDYCDYENMQKNNDRNKEDL